MNNTLINFFYFFILKNENYCDVVPATLLHGGPVTKKSKNSRPAVPRRALRRVLRIEHNYHGSGVSRSDSYQVLQSQFLPRPKQLVLIVEKYTKIYIRERRIICQSNLKRLKSLCCTVGPGGNTEWDY
jgi:hypothetical protein